jgi:hypothetical protein
MWECLRNPRPPFCLKCIKLNMAILTTIGGSHMWRSCAVKWRWYSSSGQHCRAALCSRLLLWGRSSRTLVLTLLQFHRHSSKDMQFRNEFSIFNCGSGPSASCARTIYPFILIKHTVLFKVTLMTSMAHYQNMYQIVYVIMCIPYVLCWNGYFK